MLARSSAIRLAGGTIGVAMLTAAWCAGAWAQSEPPARSEGPVPPPGISLTPPRPIPTPLLPEARRAPSGEAPESRQEPSQYPQGGGCRYQESPLELIV